MFTKGTNLEHLQIVILGIGLMFYMPAVIHYCWNSFFVSTFALPVLSYYMIFSMRILYVFMRMRTYSDINITIKNRIDTMCSQYIGGIMCVILFYFI